MFKKITVKLRIFFYILLYMKLSCNSLAEVWGTMEGFENEMTSYKESFELNIIESKYEQEDTHFKIPQKLKEAV